MDEADITAQRQEVEMQFLLRQRRVAGPKPTGHCLWCGERVAQHLRWCSVECRDDWEHDHARRKV
jgi:predicted nucleic acid-binding Zn ribbon protein